MIVLRAMAYEAPQTIEDRISTIALAFGNDPQLAIAISMCESQNRQFDKNGNVLRGKVNSKDVGVMQINETYHLKDSKKLGIDIYTERGNIVYGNWLLKTKGTQPWLASKSCWKKKLV